MNLSQPRHFRFDGGAPDVAVVLNSGENDFFFFFWGTRKNRKGLCVSAQVVV